MQKGRGSRQILSSLLPFLEFSFLFFLIKKQPYRQTGHELLLLQELHTTDIFECVIIYYEVNIIKSLCFTLSALHYIPILLESYIILVIMDITT